MAESPKLDDYTRNTGLAFSTPAGKAVLDEMVARHVMAKSAGRTCSEAQLRYEIGQCDLVLEILDRMKQCKG
jgi:hypothetical protein